jgi:hypothetical protein
MTWVYDPTDLPSDATNGLTDATTDQKKNFVRFLIGDVNTARQLTSDEAILACMSTEPNVYHAAARAILAIIQDILAGGIEDQKVGETRIRIKRADELVALAKDLRRRGDTHKKPSGGGITLADREALQENDNLLQPAITRGMHDISNSIDQPGGKTDVGGTDLSTP